MKKEQRRMAFYEIGGGLLGMEVQELFEKAQDVARQRELPIKVNLSITVYPPDDSAQFGGIIYTTDLKQPAKISEKHITILNKDGQVVRDAAEPVAQLDLLSNTVNTAEFRKAENQ